MFKIRRVRNGQSFCVRSESIKRCIEKCEGNKDLIASIRAELERQRTEKKRKEERKAAQEAENAKKKEEKQARLEMKKREKTRQDGDKQYELMPSEQRVQIDTWKGFKSGGSGSTNEPSAPETTARPKLVLRKNKKEES